MPAFHDDLVIGVDGGGTKTLAWVARRDERSNIVTSGQGQSGPGNPRAVGFEAAQRSIQDAIAKALSAAGRTPGSVASVCFGLAGAGRSAEQQQIAQWASAVGISDRVRVCGDIELVLAAGSEDHTGVALISGTGSMAWGRNSLGETARSGGWGYLFGDEGSAYWIAVEALRTAAKSADHRLLRDSLTAAILTELGAGHPSELIEIVYAPETSRERIASLAKVVFENAASPLAMDILSRAAEELASMVYALHERLKFQSGYSLSLAGSVLLNQPRFIEAVASKLKSKGSEPGQIATISEPVRGAVALAKRNLTDSNG